MSDNTINTETKQHSILSPSSSKIWLTCTPSAQMCALMPQENTAFTMEGTLAHELAEYKVRKYIIGDETAVDPHVEHGNEITEEMEKNTDMYLRYAKNIVEAFEEDGFVPDVFTEIPLDLSAFIPEGKGTADLVIIAGDTIKIIDFKYGAFSKVEGDENTQMMIYALGTNEKFKADYGPFTNVSMTIFQPRMDNVATYEMAEAKLVEWKDTILIPKAKIAIEGLGDLVMGDHCTFCRAKNFCKLYRAESIKNLEIIKNMKNELDETMADLPVKERTAAAIANLLSLEDIAKVLTLSEGLETWTNAVKDRALSEALDGKTIPGYKLIEKAGSDVVTEEAAEAFKALGYNPYKPAAYKSKTAMREEMKKEQKEKLFVTEIQPLLVKSDSSPALVSNEKKGKAMTSQYFKELEEKRAKAKAEAEALAKETA